MVRSTTRLTLKEFLALPETDVAYELVDGQAITKMSPKFFHSSVTGAIFLCLKQWCQDKGRVGIEWAILLKKNGEDWVPVPDLLYISYNRLAEDWMKDEPCPVAPDLAIEVISPGQSFGDLSEKAVNYLSAGISRVWLVDTKARSITIFYPDAPPQTKRGTAALFDSVLEGLQFTPEQIFQQAGLPD